MTRLTALALFAVALVLVLGTCLIDGSAPVGEDLCLVAVAVTRDPDLGPPRGLVGIVALEAPGATPLFRLDLVAPPPRA